MLQTEVLNKEKNDSFKLLLFFPDIEVLLCVTAAFYPSE